MKKKINIVFCGTPDIASKILQNIIKIDNVNIKLVISQPDKKIGRSKQTSFTPVKEVCVKNGLNIIQPIKINDALEDLKSIDYDLLITCAYGQFIPNSILDLAKVNNINIHGSLLPKYRGGAPIQYAIMNGEKETGISLMKMISKMDAGEYYVQEKIKIEDYYDYGLLKDKLAELGSKMIRENILFLYENKIKGIEQKEENVTFSKNITTEEEKINWSDSSLKIFNFVRSLSPNPIAHSFINEIRYKIKKVSIIDSINNFSSNSFKEGEIVDLDSEGILVKTKDSFIKILLIQKQGKKMINAGNYKNSNSKELKVGDIFS